jgi:sec-independent protein translocase protein TatA
MGIGISELLVILVIVIVLFGTKKIRNLGADLGGAIRSFRTALKEGESDKVEETETQNKVIDGELLDKTNEKV